MSIRDAHAQLASAHEDMRRLRVIVMGLLNDLNRKDARILELEAIIAAAVTAGTIASASRSHNQLPRESPGEPARGGAQAIGNQESRGVGSKGTAAGGSKKRKIA